MRPLLVFVQMSDIFRISKVLVTSGFRQKELADTKRITIEEETQAVVAKEETAFILHNVRNALQTAARLAAYMLSL